MKELISKHLKSDKMPIIFIITVIVIILLILLSFGFLFWQDRVAKKEAVAINQVLADRVSMLESALNLTKETSQELAQKLREEQQKSAEFEESISDISGTVNTLEKLSKTDKELLQKYSKVYFLSDNYVPLRLKTIDTDYLMDSVKDMQFHALALPYLEKMFDRAKSDGVTLKIVSAYRSFGTQAVLKNGYLVTYGSGANQFSADQGYSEHQLGTTVDITTDDSSLSISFEKTEAFLWLEKNAYKYGFTLSYPKGNAYYQYEPWHWRFVGVKLATKLHNDGIYFSDMDQRDIDKYLVKIFD